MTDTGVRFVQFPHPGGEHNPPDHEMPWNVAGHRRKFLIAPGDYVDAADRHDDVEVVFWGEWSHRHGSSAAGQPMVGCPARCIAPTGSSRRPAGSARTPTLACSATT